MIKSIFISHHFDDTGNRLAELVKALVISHNIQPVTGRRLEGEVLSNGVKSRIDNCQATIVLLTDREEGKSNQWVIEERAYADKQEHSTITLLEKGLIDSGMYSNNERLRIDWTALHICLLELSETIKLWKRTRGNNLKILIQPEEISKKISDNYDEAIIRYKVLDSNDYDAEVSWKDAKARRNPGGATIKIRGVKEKDQIEIKVVVDGETWTSPVINPIAMVKLEKR